MKNLTRALLGATALVAAGFAAQAETITVATVNNGDMIRILWIFFQYFSNNLFYKK